jgi:hypothetical protein
VRVIIGAAVNIAISQIDVEPTLGRVVEANTQHGQRALVLMGYQDEVRVRDHVIE